jgi:hypothetical protein
MLKFQRSIDALFERQTALEAETKPSLAPWFVSGLNFNRYSHKTIQNTTKYAKFGLDSSYEAL